MNFEQKVDKVLKDQKEILMAKNKAYGNSALEPVRIFSKVDAVEQLKVRIDDKLSRLAKGNDFADEDTVTDLLGYLVLLKVALLGDGTSIKLTEVMEEEDGAEYRQVEEEEEETNIPFSDLDIYSKQAIIKLDVRAKLNIPDVGYTWEITHHSGGTYLVQISTKERLVANFTWEEGVDSAELGSRTGYYTF